MTLYNKPNPILLGKQGRPTNDVKLSSCQSSNLNSLVSDLNDKSMTVNLQVLYNHWYQSLLFCMFHQTLNFIIMSYSSIHNAKIKKENILVQNAKSGEAIASGTTVSRSSNNVPTFYLFLLSQFLALLLGTFSSYIDF